MKRLILPAVAVLIVAAGASFVSAQEEPISKEQLAAKLQELLPDMSKEKIPDRHGAQQQFQQICFALGTPGREKERADACAVMTEALGTDLAKPARIWLIKQLQYLGHQECVAAVAKSLDDSDEHVRDAARRALTNIPVPQANAALLAKLGGAKGTLRVGLINSLGYRADPASVAALTGLVGDRDQATAAAAANALGKIGGSQAAGALKSALAKAPAALRAPLADACLRCADKMLAAGQAIEAMAIYNELAKQSSPKAIRIAAMRGKLKAAGK